MSGCVCPQGTVLLVGEDHLFSRTHKIVVYKAYSNTTPVSATTYFHGVASN